MRKSVILSLALASAFAAPTVSAEEVQSAPQLATARSLQLTKVILDSETHPTSMRTKGGTLCVFASTEEFPKEKKTQDYERFDQLFSTTVKKHDFTVVSTSQDMFASEAPDSKGDILVGATMMPETLNLCSSVKGWKGAITVGVDWQLYDRKSQKVVGMVHTSGQAELLKFDQDGYTNLWNQAFVTSLEALLQQQSVREIVGVPAAANPAKPSA